MWRFLDKPKNFVLTVFALAIITVIAGNVVMPEHKVEAGWNVGTAGNPSDFLIEVAKGNVPGHSVIHKFGHANVGATYTPICISGFYRTPTTAVALEIVSDDADDTAAGTGARSVVIQGIGDDWSQVNQTVVLSGTTAVAIPISLRRVFRWYVLTTGVYGSQAVGAHEGVLTIRELTAGPTWSQLETTGFPGGQSEITAYTVPDGFHAMVYVQEIRVDSTKSADVIFMKREGADIITAPFTGFRTQGHHIGISNLGGSDPNAPMDSYPARTDLIYMGKVTSSTADISIIFEIILIKDGF